jgi:glutamyl-tRNA reductase
MAAKTEGTAPVLVGTSHQRARVALREQLYLTPPEAAKFAGGLADNGGEAVVLSTCNRIEAHLPQGGDCSRPPGTR